MEQRGRIHRHREATRLPRLHLQLALEKSVNQIVEGVQTLCSQTNPFPTSSRFTSSQLLSYK